MCVCVGVGVTVVCLRKERCRFKTTMMEVINETDDDRVKMR